MTYTLRSRHSGDLWLNLPAGYDGKPRSARVPQRGIITLPKADYDYVDVQAAMRTGVLVLIKQD